MSIVTVITFVLDRVHHILHILHFFRRCEFDKYETRVSRREVQNYTTIENVRASEGIQVFNMQAPYDPTTAPGCLFAPPLSTV